MVVESDDLGPLKLCELLHRRRTTFTDRWMNELLLGEVPGLLPELPGLLLDEVGDWHADRRCLGLLGNRPVAVGDRDRGRPNCSKGTAVCCVDGPNTLVV